MVEKCAEVTNDLIYKTLQTMQRSLGRLVDVCLLSAA